MRTIKLSILAIVSAFTISTFTGCAKGDKGDTGPQGPQGPAGSSNVSVTNFSVPPGNWNLYSATQWYYNVSGVSIPATDVCMVYYSIDDAAFNPLPAPNVYYNGDDITYTFETGFTLQISYYNPASVAITQTLYFNVADIPPAACPGPHFNYKDYNAVSKLPGVRIFKISQ